ncbi:hypothetical protein ERO13_D05G388300v2 [Gossypium hirsutum]|nr:hypothetical protein ERO13_D05G388300v2 [Gossypium hirsutum]
MVAVERQRQNRDQMMAESLKAMESEGSVMDIIQLHCLVSGIGAHDIGRLN